MHIVILAAGSRGDIQPYLALANGLKHPDYRVKLATHSNYRDWIESYGIEYAELHGNPREMTEKGEVNEWVSSGGSPTKFVREFKRVIVPILERMTHDVWQASKGADLILPSALCYYQTYIVAREQKTPWMQTYLQPIHPTSDFPTALLPAHRSYGIFGNLMSHYIGGMIMWQAMRPAYNEVLMKELGLKPFPWEGVFTEVEKVAIPALYSYSPSFLPKPRDWAEYLHVTGYWFLDEGREWTPPPELADFLNAGPAPIYVGFGSMALRDPERTARIVVEALIKAGQRGIILRGWGGMNHIDLPESILMIDSAPHDWLFPRMAAVVHHGGAGTTAAGLRAGKPSVIIPFFADQPWWGMRVYERRLGPKPILRNELTVDNFARAIQYTLNNMEIRERATRLGEKIRAEDGVGCAISLVNEYVRHQGAVT